MATNNSGRKTAVRDMSAPPPKKRVPVNKPGAVMQKKPAVARKVGSVPKTGAPKKSAPKTEAAKQLSTLTQPIAVRRKAEAMQKAKATAGRRAAAAVPTGRGASGAATKKNTPGTVTRGKSNFVLEALRNAANSMTTNREKAINERLWREGGNRPTTKPTAKGVSKAVKTKGK